jgi:hypothetical protein
VIKNYVTDSHLGILLVIFLKKTFPAVAKITRREPTNSDMDHPKDLGDAPKN